MAETRYANIQIAKILSTYFQPDTGKTVTLRKPDGTTVIATATETPASSGNYVATWDAGTQTCRYGFWYVNGTIVNVERVDVGLRPRIFYDVTVYDSSASPSGAVGAEKTFTTGSGSLATDSESNGSFNFATVPQILICSKQTRMCVQYGLATVSGGNVSFQTQVLESGTNYAGGTTCKADIIIVPRYQ